MRPRHLLFLAALLAVAGAAAGADLLVRPPAVRQGTDKKAEFDKRLKAGEGKAAELWKLHEWCGTNGLTFQQNQVLRAILKASPGDRKAHELLGHVELEGQWFDNQRKVDEFKKKQLEAEAQRTGKAVYKGQLVDPADVPFLEQGLVRDEQGNWHDPVLKQRLAEGYVLQDLEWIPPDQAENIQKGLWKCGEKWLPEAEANAWHSEIGRWWKVPGERCAVYTTCTRDIARRALAEMETAYAQMVRLFGRVPARKPAVLVLSGPDQYNTFAQGSDGEPVELRALSSVHGAFLAELWPMPALDRLAGGGVCYWDASNDSGNSFGPLWVRHALAQSFVEAIDPSPKTLAAILDQTLRTSAVEAYWEEKQLPDWLRIGAATYTERYHQDPRFPDPRSLFDWSISNLASKGGLDPVSELVKARPGVDDPAAAGKLYIEFGLLVAFILDGKSEKLAARHAALKAALVEGKDVRAAVQGLEQELIDQEAELRKFAGI